MPTGDIDIEFPGDHVSAKFRALRGQKVIQNNVNYKKES